MENYLKRGDIVLLVHTSDDCAENCQELVSRIAESTRSRTNVIIDSDENILTGSQPSSTFTVVISGYRLPFYHTPEILREYYRVLQPSGVLLFDELFKETSEDDEELKFYPHFANRLRLNGFIVDRPDTGNGASPITKVSARKPNYESSSKVELKLPNKLGNISLEPKITWKINEDTEDDLIDEESLIDPKEVIQTQSFDAACKPKNSGKRRACKNCTCGLAEEKENEKKSEEKEKEIQKSSCGSCYLGDAFRCASCPYLGMPAFKPGEKVVIPSMD